MKNSVKIFLFLFIMALTIFFLKPWETSDKLVDSNSAQVVTPQVGSNAGARKNRAPASVGNPGEASALSIRE
jgi:hypothetical protein